MRAIPFPALAAAAAVALGVLPVRAAEAPPIRVSLPSCPSPPFSIAAFLGLLEVELAGHDPPCCVLAPPTAANDGGAAGPLVALSLDSCDAGATAVDVRVQDGRGKAAQRRVGLGDIPDEARPRALALAAAELVHSLAQAPVAPLAPPAIAAAPAAAPARLPTLAASGLVQLEPHPGNNMLLWGLAASLGAGRGLWQAALDLQYLSGDPSMPLGDVRTTMLAAALTAGPRFALGRVVLDVGATGRLGWCWMSGHVTTPNGLAGSGSALVGSAGGRLGILLPTAAGVSHLRAVVEGGAMIHGLEAEVNGAGVAGVAGGYLLFGLGFGEHR
ncbi:MAG TPA: hypothetical protein VGP64_14845 [Polyangia bacterium]|jgi:hypothetical protein